MFMLINVLTMGGFQNFGKFAKLKCACSGLILDG